MLVNKNLLYLLLLMIQFAHHQVSTSIESPEQHSVKEIILIMGIKKSLAQESGTSSSRSSLREPLKPLLKKRIQSMLVSIFEEVDSFINIHQIISKVKPSVTRE